MYNIASCMFQDSFKVKYKVSDAVQFLSEMDETWIWQIIVIGGCTLLQFRNEMSFELS